MGKVKTNTLWFGAIMGIIVAFISFIMIYFLREPDMIFMEYIRTLYFLRILPKLMSLCLLPNLLLFFVFMRIEHLRAAQGVILSLFIIGLPIVILKFI